MSETFTGYRYAGYCGAAHERFKRLMQIESLQLFLVKDPRHYYFYKGIKYPHFDDKGNEYDLGAATTLRIDPKNMSLGNIGNLCDQLLDPLSQVNIATKDTMSNSLSLLDLDEKLVGKTRAEIVRRGKQTVHILSVSNLLQFKPVTEKRTFWGGLHNWWMDEHGFIDEKYKSLTCPTYANCQNFRTMVDMGHRLVNELEMLQLRKGSR